MSNKSDFDNGFDQGFNTGYDLGYERGIIECKELQKDNLCTLLSNSQLSKELFSNLVLTIDKDQFIELFKKFASDISITPLGYQAIYEKIFDAINNKNPYSVLATSDLIKELNKNKDYKDMITALRNSDVLLMPSLLQSDVMFCLNQFFYNHDIFTDFGLTSVPHNMFKSKLLRDLNGLGEFYIYDENASHISSYLNDNRIRCRDANKTFSVNKVCLIGKYPHKWSTIEFMQINKNIVIDIQEIRSQLINKILPIGLK